MKKALESLKHPKVSTPDLNSPENIAVRNERYLQQQKAIAEAGDLKKITKIKDANEQIESLNELMWKRYGQTVVLIEQLNSPVKSEAFSAAFLLGELHLSGGLPALTSLIGTKNLDARPYDSDSHHPALWGNYPMAEAVMKFGHSASPTIIDRIATTEDPENRRILIETLVSIEGQEAARHKLQDALKLEQNINKKGHLQSALTGL